MSGYSGYTDDEHFPFRKYKKSAAQKKKDILVSLTKADWSFVGRFTFLCMLFATLLKIVSTPAYLNQVVSYFSSDVRPDIEEFHDVAREAKENLRRQFDAGTAQDKGADNFSEFERPAGKVKMADHLEGEAYYFLYAGGRIEKVDKRTYESVPLARQKARPSAAPEAGTGSQGKAQTLIDGIKKLIEGR